MKMPLSRCMCATYRCVGFRVCIMRKYNSVIVCQDSLVHVCQCVQCHSKDDRIICGLKVVGGDIACSCTACHWHAHVKTFFFFKPGYTPTCVGIKYQRHTCKYVQLYIHIHTHAYSQMWSYGLVDCSIAMLQTSLIFLYVYILTW